MLRDRFAQLCGTFGVPSRAGPLWDILEPLYQFPARFYHSLGHIEACLRTRDECSSTPEDQPTLELAVFLHDCVYDARRHDNEERSAAIAEVFCDALSIHGPRRALVTGIILATKHTGEPLSGDAALMVDLDLAGLAADWDTCWSHASAIRREYAWVSDEDFRYGRAAFLEALLARPALYHHPWFKQELEHRARENVTRQAAALRAGGLP
jgi:predicted metal-dependent HD superfamily phosphohydrolase